MTERNKSARGFVNHPMYRILMDAVSDIKGAYIELGVNDVWTFDHIYKRALHSNHAVAAVDSFRGMPKSEHEYENKAYPEGKYNTGGADWFKKKYPLAYVYEGIIPEILSKIDSSNIFAFAHIDIDFDRSTYETLKWIWDKMNPGGIVVCHDYLPGNNTFATKGIKDWMKETNIMPVMLCDTSVVFRQGDSIQSLLDEMPQWQADIIQRNYLRD